MSAERSRSFYFSILIEVSAALNLTFISIIASCKVNFELTNDIHRFLRCICKKILNLHTTKLSEKLEIRHSEVISEAQQIEN